MKKSELKTIIKECIIEEQLKGKLGKLALRFVNNGFDTEMSSIEGY